MVILLAMQGFFKANKMGRNQLGSLMNQLKKGVLGIGAWLSPNQISCLIVNSIALAVNTLPIALHNALLQVGRQTVEVLV